MQKKFSQFKLLYAEISQKLNAGFTYLEIVNFLKNDYQLDLTVKTFGSYLYRYKKSKPNSAEFGIEKQNEPSKAIVVSNAAALETTEQSDTLGEVIPHSNAVSLKNLNSKADILMQEALKANKPKGAIKWKLV